VYTHCTQSTPSSITQSTTFARRNQVGIVLKRGEEPAESSLNVPEGWTLFEWAVADSDAPPLAVTLAGSWNNFEVEAMLKRKDKFVTALDLPVGRYTYYYKVATYEDIVVCASQEEGRYPQEISVLGEQHQVNTLHIIAEDRPNGTEELTAWRAKEEELFRKAMTRVEEVAPPEQVCVVVGVWTVWSLAVHGVRRGVWCAPECVAMCSNSVW
jgi:hypothetical protein